MDRVRPQSSGLDLIDSRAVTATASYQIAILGCRLTSRAAPRREHPPIWETDFCHQRLACAWSPLNDANELNPDRTRFSFGQAIEITTVPSNPETGAVRQDWMVDDTGIEPAVPFV